ncbi:unnamed protein product [Ceutorhynchus assimilis]|uniref:cGMP-dependent protein kinase n=1 Tax=Ceutorhynchus assimilis TaxID=467358 RepID=A0A9N9MSU9_9CUCU|nr:unnamed protein product [Ceutorhynchus assimilis]
MKKCWFCGESNSYIVSSGISGKTPSKNGKVSVQRTVTLGDGEEPAVIQQNHEVTVNSRNHKPSVPNRNLTNQNETPDKELDEIKSRYDNTSQIVSKEYKNSNPKSSTSTKIEISAITLEIQEPRSATRTDNYSSATSTLEKKHRAPEPPSEIAPLARESENYLLRAPSIRESLSRASSASSLDITNENGTNGGGLAEESQQMRRRSGVQVSAPTTVEVSANEQLPVFAKSTEDEEGIRKAIEANEFLSKILSGKRLNDIINAMQLRDVPAKKTLIKQGDKGSEMFVSKSGKYKILVNRKVVDEFDNTRVFGELAILYNAKRLATIQAVTAGQVWVLERQLYQKIVISSNLKEQDENLHFLQNVEYLNVVDVDVLRQVSNLLKPEFFAPGTVIIRQGDKGDKFYIIRAGVVTVSKSGEGVLGMLQKGKCFGEKALQKEDTRQATVTAEAPGVECLTLTRRDFINHFGDVEIPMIMVKKVSDMKTDMLGEYQDIILEDLKIIKTLGVGGFGRVELVQHKKHKNKVFALKYLKKIEIVYQNQQEHVYNEKMIQMNCRSPFIARLYRTYKDNKYVYFLMESCLGGDLFSLLHKQKGKRFEEKDAKFLSACVVEALEHLHSKGIVYRDLKPENLLLDKNGYLKLTDFGFAKKMPPRGKTFTFAGTPEYVAPEIVLNRGHDRAVDYWAFGAFIFELLTGRTPFRTGDSSHMRTYNKILNGIDNVNFPTYMNPKARNMIEKLCRPVPAERLGMQRGGTRDIKAHKWYQGFDWQKFQHLSMPSSFKPKLKDAIDTSNFDFFKQDKDFPPDETSGWDIHF